MFWQRLWVQNKDRIPAILGSGESSGDWQGPCALADFAEGMLGFSGEPRNLQINNIKL